MTEPRTQIRVRSYVSGWCEAALHERCKGSYAGTDCCCSCHRLASGSTAGVPAPPPESGK